MRSIELHSIVTNITKNHKLLKLFLFLSTVVLISSNSFIQVFDI